jgi:hypothetical protein
MRSSIIQPSMKWLISWGENFTDHKDIPESWQFDVLLPRVIEDGIFEGALQYNDFSKGRLRNIAGDSVDVDFLNIDENFRLVASNGIIFKYKNYKVPEAMYLLERKVQGEHLIRPVGAGTYGWKQGVVTSGGAGRAPTLSYSAAADNDSLIQLDFGTRFNGQFNWNSIYLRYSHGDIVLSGKRIHGHQEFLKYT